MKDGISIGYRRHDRIQVRISEGKHFSRRQRPIEGCYPELRLNLLVPIPAFDNRRRSQVILRNAEFYLSH